MTFSLILSHCLFWILAFTWKELSFLSSFTLVWYFTIIFKLNESKLNVAIWIFTIKIVRNRQLFFIVMTVLSRHLLRNISFFDINNSIKYLRLKMSFWNKCLNAAQVGIQEFFGFLFSILLWNVTISGNKEKCLISFPFFFPTPSKWRLISIIREIFHCANNGI